ncbi:MAG TPA: 50S ribosomal protein L30 [Saprospiraceae bacterium]|nr:50S ribosomal protein L30 [Saprospiraceae bacterium]
MAKVKITQVKSVIKANVRQKLTMQALGLRNVHDSVELEFTPQIKGMTDKLRHLLTIEKI